MKYKLSIATLVLGLLCGNAQAQDTATDEQLDAFIAEATEIFEKNQANPKKRIPDELLGDAEAIMILSITKGGIILGASNGAGVAFKNNIENWSPPAFYTVSSGSLGLQIGASQSNLIALLMTDKAVAMLDNKEIKWGVGLEIVAGPTVANIKANTLPKKADIFVYDTTKGLDVGVAISGGVLVPNQAFNAELYDKKDITVEWILGSRVPMPEAAEGLTLLLRDYSYLNK